MSPPREARSPRFPLGLDQVARQPGAAARPAPVAPAAAAGAAPTAPAKAAASAAPAPLRSLIRPQRLLHEAARDAARQDPPRGLGLDSAQVRHRMVERLRQGGLRHDRVCEALRQVPRHQFVDTAREARPAWPHMRGEGFTRLHGKGENIADLIHHEAEHLALPFHANGHWLLRV